MEMQGKLHETRHAANVYQAYGRECPGQQCRKTSPRRLQKYEGPPSGLDLELFFFLTTSGMNDIRMKGQVRSTKTKKEKESNRQRVDSQNVPHATHKAAEFKLERAFLITANGQRRFGR